MATTGQRFSQLYLERGQPTRDSARFRNRLASYFGDHLWHRHNSSCVRMYEREVGVDVPHYGAAQNFSEVFKKAELRDVLDAVTITHDVLTASRDFQAAREWIAFVARVMHEENVGYRVDANGVVHFHVDQEFERNRAATVAVLELPQFGAARSAFEDAYRHLDADPQDTKAAVRSMFEALETMAKLIVPGVNSLTRNLCLQKLKEACLAVAGGDVTEQEVLTTMFMSLGYWVEANHDYRHGQRAHERVAPSEETAVLILATGTGFLRQLAVYASRMTLASPVAVPTIAK